MYGGTPLYWAAQFNEASAVLEVLLEAGANPRASHESGATPYDVAKPQHREILQKAMLMRTAFDTSGKSGDSTTVMSETITNTLSLGEAMPNRSSDYQWKKIAIGALIICGVLVGFVYLIRDAIVFN